MKLSFGFAIALIGVSSCDINRPQGTNDQVSGANMEGREPQGDQVVGANMESRCAAALSEGNPLVAARTSADEMNTVCSCAKQILTASDLELWVQSWELGNELTREGLPRDVVTYQVVTRMAETTGEDGSVVRQRIFQAGDLVSAHCPMP